MMGRSLLVVFAMSACASAIAWMASPAGGDVVDRHMLEAYPDDFARARRVARASAAAERLTEHLPATLAHRPAVVRAAMHGGFAMDAFIVFLPLLGAAVALGLCRRERARTLARFSSPTVAYAAKRLFGAALVALAVFASTPVALPYWVVYAAIGAMTVALELYVENIPVRI